MNRRQRIAIAALCLLASLSLAGMFLIREVREGRAVTVLRNLDLSGTPITDASAEAISRLPKLTSLRIIQTQLTDQSLDRFKLLANLRELEVGPNFTQQSAKQLHRHLLNCKIRGFAQNGTFSFSIGLREE